MTLRVFIMSLNGYVQLYITILMCYEIILKHELAMKWLLTIMKKKVKVCQVKLPVQPPDKIGGKSWEVNIVKAQMS